MKCSNRLNELKHSVGFVFTRTHQQGAKKMLCAIVIDLWGTLNKLICLLDWWEHSFLESFVSRIVPELYFPEQTKHLWQG